jgi:hypothetical protein
MGVVAEPAEVINSGPVASGLTCELAINLPVNRCSFLGTIPGNQEPMGWLA